MALSLASVQQPLHTISIPDPIARQRSLADLRNSQQETEINALKIDSAKNQNQEWAQVRAIFDKHAGDKEGAISEVLQTPWRNKEITDTYQNEVTRMRKEAAENASLIQGKTAPEIQAAAPQTTTAPIQTSLDDSAQMSTPQTSAPQTQNVPLPIKPVHLPFGPDIPVESAQQAFSRLRQTKQMESDIGRDAKIAEDQAARDAKRDEDYTLNPGDRRMRGNQIIAEGAARPVAAVAPHTVTTAEGVMQFDPAKNSWFKIGNRPPSLAQSGQADTDAKDIAQAIMSGEQPPVLTGLYRLAGPVRAELSRNGFDLSTATRDWTAVQKHLATLNGAQQERLRQAISFTNDTLPQIKDAYAEWKKQAGTSGFKILNKANLAAMKQLPGAAGSAATNLEALISDFTSELGTVYKGGNGSTDESLKLAAKNLEGNWNEATFNDAISRLERSLQIRSNSISTSQPAGVSANSPYNQIAAPAAPTAPTQAETKVKLPDGSTGVYGSDGKLIRVEK